MRGESGLMRVDKTLAAVPSSSAWQKCIGGVDAQVVRTVLHCHAMATSGTQK